MRIGTGAAVAIFALVAAAAPVSAQRGLRVIDESSDEAVQFTPYVGYLTFGNFFSRRTGSSFSSDDAAVVGAQLALKLAPSISFYGNLGYARSNTQVDIPLAQSAAAANTNVWLYDGGLQFSVPTGPFGRGSVKPFFQIGAGAMHFDFDDGSQGVPSTSATNFAWNAGVGIDARIGRPRQHANRCCTLPIPLRPDNPEPTLVLQLSSSHVLGEQQPLRSTVSRREEPVHREGARV